MKKRSISLLFATILAAGVAAPLSDAQAVILINGSFEDGPENIGDFATLSDGSTAINGWIVGGSIDYIGDYWQHDHGNRSLDMDGNFPGSIRQTLTGLKVNQQYTVSFSIAGNTDAGSPIKDLGLTVGVDGDTFSFNTTGNSRTSMGWITAYFSFIADSSTADLTFSSLSNGGPYGAALDNVGISETPLPAALPLFATALGGFGFFSWFRRRATATA